MSSDAQHPVAAPDMAQNIAAVTILMLPQLQGAHHPLPGYAAPFLNVSPTASHPAFQLPQAAPALAVPYPGYMQIPGAEMLIASAYGIPKPTLPVFESGCESDFALLKMALDNLLNAHGHLCEQYKFQVLLGHLKLPSTLQLAKAYMCDARPYITTLQALQEKYGHPRQLVQCELGAILNTPADRTYTLPDLAAWLQIKSQAKCISSQAVSLYQSEVSKTARREPCTTNSNGGSASVLLTKEELLNPPEPSRTKSTAKSEPIANIVIIRSTTSTPVKSLRN